MKDYKCNKCNFQDEYSTAESVPKEMQLPEVCPKCKEGKMEMQWGNMGKVSVDVKGGYEYEYGKKARFHKDQSFHADVIANEKINPY